MTTTNPVQDTTVIQPPDLPLSVYEAIRNGIQAAYPQQAARIARGLDTLMTTEIRTTDELGVYLIATSGNPSFYYRTTGLRCICPDHLQRGVVCRHSWATVLFSVATAHAAWYRATGTRPADDRDSDAPIPYVVLERKQRARQLAGVGA